MHYPCGTPLRQPHCSLQPLPRPATHLCHVWAEATPCPVCVFWLEHPCSTVGETRSGVQGVRQHSACWGECVQEMRPASCSPSATASGSPLQPLPGA